MVLRTSAGELRGPVIAYFPPDMRGTASGVPPGSDIKTEGPPLLAQGRRYPDGAGPGCQSRWFLIEIRRGQAGELGPESRGIGPGELSYPPGTKMLEPQVDDA